MKKLEDRLLGSAERFSFERRVFNFIMLLGSVLNLFGTVMDVWYGEEAWVDLAFLAFWALCYYLVRFKNGYQRISIIAIAVLIFAFIPYEWLTNGGALGSIPYYTVLFMAVAALLFRGRLRVGLIASMVAVVLLLIGYDILTGRITWGHFFGIAIHLVVILIAAALLIAVYSRTYEREKQRSEAYARTIEINARQQLYYVENLEQLIGRLKSERHDFNNHLSVIHGLLETGDSDKAKAYTAALVKGACEYQSIVSMPYPAVRALLNHKLSTARDSGIELKLDINMPEGLKINEFDLAAILGNLLDNAIEACAALTEASPYIRLTILYQPDYLTIHVANPFSTLPEGAKRPSKPEPENHGFGLKNVRYLVEKYNGIMEIKSKDGIFVVDIALLAV